MPVATTVASEVGVKVGDFFVCSWGYDQTNIDFYKVVGVTASGKSVKVQKWSSAAAAEQPSGFSTTERVVPGSSPARGANVRQPEGYSLWDPSREAPVKTKRLQHYMSGDTPRVYFHVNDYSSAYPWDGTAKSETAFGFGH